MTIQALPTLDAHAHLQPTPTAAEIAGTGAVLAISISLDEAARGLGRGDALVAWGVGCHPRKNGYQEEFAPGRFGALAEKAAFIGEVGLDAGTSRAPWEIQLRTFRCVLDVVTDLPRPTSIHAYTATGPVIEELRRRPIAVPILHGWPGSAAETREAVALGCYFSIHSQVARRSVYRTQVPPDRVLLETDHGYNDPPAAIPCRIQWVEYLVAQQYRLPVREVRRLAWRNPAAAFAEAGTLDRLPKQMTAIISRLEAKT